MTGFEPIGVTIKLVADNVNALPEGVPKFSPSQISTIVGSLLIEVRLSYYLATN